MAIGILVLQLGAMVAFANKRLLIALFAFYDALHLGIFLLAGANFWPWFMINLAIIAAVHRLPAAWFTRQRLVSSIALILWFPLIGKFVWLGWYDTRAVNSAYFAVEDDAGKRTR